MEKLTEQKNITTYKGYHFTDLLYPKLYLLVYLNTKRTTLPQTESAVCESSGAMTEEVGCAAGKL